MSSLAEDVPTVTHVVAKTLVFDQRGRLLVLKRSDDDEHRPGGWDFPGGQVDDDEPVVDGAVREVFEETGLKLGPEAMQLCFASAKTNYRPRLGRNVNIVWLGYVTFLPTGGKVRLSHEHSSHEWMALDDFLNASGHPAHHELVGYMRQNRIAAELWDKEPAR